MVNSWNCACRKRPLICTVMPTKKVTCLANIQFATHATANLWFSVRSLLCMESAIANIVICAYGIWNRPEEDLQKDFPFELARANKPSGRAPRQQVFMTGVWAPITMASAQASRDRALIRTIWMATATSFRTLPKVTKSICSDSAEAPTPCAH